MIGRQAGFYLNPLFAEDVEVLRADIVGRVGLISPAIPLAAYRIDLKPAYASFSILQFK